jgi:hypothetical protein
MYEPDGPEERTAENDSSYDNVEHEFDLREQAADESRDDLEVTLVTPIPVRCVVNGHDHLTGPFCFHCGAEKSLLDIAADRLRQFTLTETV